MSTVLREPSPFPDRPGTSAPLAALTAPPRFGFAFILAVGCLIALSASLAEASEAVAATRINEGAAWEHAAQQDGIDVYTRAVAGSGIKEFKGVGEVDADADQILALLRDSDHFNTWFPNTPESKLLKREGNVSYQYSVLATPWPISDRDNVLRSVTNVDHEAGVVQISVAAAPDEYPEHADRVRVRKANGSWRLETLGDNRTRVTFSMHLEPGGGIPQWMINARVVETPLEALANLRTAVNLHTAMKAN